MADLRSRVSGIRAYQSKLQSIKPTLTDVIQFVVSIAEAFEIVSQQISQLTSSISSSSGSSGAPKYTGTQLSVIDQPNGVWSLPATPTALALYRNGLRQSQGPSPADFMVVGGNVVFNALSIPSASDVILADIW